MVSRHFSRKEFACKCGCGQDTIDAELVRVLERLRMYYDVPIRVNSGNRCKAHNKKVGGSTHSQHLKGRAADIVVRDKSAATVYHQLNTWYPSQFGMGNYTTFTHIDTRREKARF